MKANILLKKAALTAVFFLSTLLLAETKFVFSPENLINKKAVIKIEEIGTEIKKKLNINLFLYANETIGGKSMVEYREEIRKQQKDPYVILLFTQKEKKVDIISSKNLENKIEAEDVLDPFSGTIIPLLITKPKKDAIDDRVSAALLNGYADIADQLAQSHHIELTTSIGNANRDIINIMRIIFYTTIIIVLGLYFRKKYGRKKQ
ncbi:MAG: TPM domain-containing protein [Campylobacteraceae bacterium]|nr:TPM domain-containing protein [Campylobacteraceae bacterium]